MDGATISAGNDDFFSCFGLDMVKQFYQNRVNKFFSIAQRQAVLLHPPAIKIVHSPIWVFMVNMRRVQTASLAAKELFSNLGLVANIRLLPRIGLSDMMLRGLDGIRNFIVVPIDKLPFGVHSANSVVPTVLDLSIPLRLKGPIKL